MANMAHASESRRYSREGTRSKQLRSRKVDVVVSPAIVRRKDTREQVVVDWTAPEGVSHWLYKVIAVKMLLLDEFTRGEIFVEHSVRAGKGLIRADVFGQRKLPNGETKTVWFECGQTSLRKLKLIQREYKNCRIVRINGVDEVVRTWFATEKYLNMDATLIPGSEIWAAYLGDEPRVVFGVRREAKNYVFLEGDWRVQYHLQLKKRDRVEPLSL